MSESLRDQLLKSGLAKNLKAAAPAPSKDKQRPNQTPPRAHKNAAERPKAPAAQRPNPSSQREPDLAHAYALRAKQEKHDREAAQREVERIAKEKRERKQKLASLLEGKAFNAADADTPRHFPHGNKIRRIYCTAAQLVELNRGDLAVVQLAGRYLLVTREIALKAQAIEESSLVLLCDPNMPSEDDVPADLVW